MQGKHFDTPGWIQLTSRNTGRGFVRRSVRQFESLEDRQLLAGDSWSLDEKCFVGACGTPLAGDLIPLAAPPAGGGSVAPGGFIPAGGEFLANTFVNNHQRQAAVAMDGAGGYVVAWQSLNQDEDRNGVYAQRYFADGSPNGGEFLVNTRTADAQENPAVAMNASGDFRPRLAKSESGWRRLGNLRAAL